MLRGVNSSIHETAIISPGAQVAEGVLIGPYAVIGENVVLGEGNTIGPHTVIEGPAVIGKSNRIVGQCAIGTVPQDLKFQGEQSTLQIGDENTIREFVTINRGTSDGGGKTTIGNNNILMTGVHVAHDCHIGHRAILANAATLGGHVEIADYATVGAFSGVHQFCRVGAYAFIGGYSVLTRDALPFIKTVGDRNRARIYGINSLGLRRIDFSLQRITALKKAYRILFQRGLKVQEAVEKIRQRGLDNEDVNIILRFIEISERGYVKNFGRDISNP